MVDNGFGILIQLMIPNLVFFALPQTVADEAWTVLDSRGDRLKRERGM